MPSTTSTRPLLLLLLPAVAVAAGCGYRATLPGAHPTPGTEPPSRGVEVPMEQEVRYEIFCQTCQVAYATASGVTHEEVEGTWSKVVRMEPTGVGYVTLTASPTNTGGYIRRATIIVNGQVAAEEKRVGGTATLDEVQLSARLPSTLAGPSGRIRAIR